MSQIRNTGKKISRGTTELSREFTLSEQKTKMLERSVNTLEDELLRSRKEKNKSAKEHKKMVKDAIIVEDIKEFNLLKQTNDEIIEELKKLYGDNRGLKRLIKKGKNYTFVIDHNATKDEEIHMAKFKENIFNLTCQSYKKCLANSAQRNNHRGRWIPKAQILKLSDVLDDGGKDTCYESRGVDVDDA